MAKAVADAERWYLMAPRTPLALGAAATATAGGLVWCMFLLSSIGSQCRENPTCARQLSRGWLPIGDGMMDLTDHQWEATRRNLPVIAAVLAGLAAGTWLVRRSLGKGAGGGGPAESAAAPPSLVAWYAVFGCVFVFVLSGLDSLLLFFIILVTYALSRVPAAATLQSAAGPLAAALPASVARLPLGPSVGVCHLLGWMALLGVGKPRGWPMDLASMSGGLLADLHAALPELYPWNQLYNLLMLRLISFLLDSHWSRLPPGKPEPDTAPRHPGAASVLPAPQDGAGAKAGARYAPPLTARAGRSQGGEHARGALDTVPAAAAARAHGHALPPLLSVARSAGVCPAGIDAWTSQRVAAELADGLDARSRRRRPESDYASLPLLLAYALYPPLMLAGPILSFNAFASQLAAPRRAAVSWGAVAWYAGRWAVALVLLEAWLHAWPLYAVNTSVVLPAGCAAAGPGCEGVPMLESLGLAETLAAWEATVVMLWLKFVVLWRLFRAMALLDGIECEENQASCVWMTSSIAGFWRGWHRSFNRWIIRYVYAPVGGARGSIQLRGIASAVSFVFVALWHDFSLQLLVWGLAFAVCAYPEMQAAALIHGGKTKWAHEARHAWWYPLLGAALGTVAVYILIAGNLVGFGPGLAGLVSYARRSASPAGALAWSAFAAWHVCVLMTSSSIRAARGYDIARPALR